MDTWNACNHLKNTIAWNCIKLFVGSICSVGLLGKALGDSNVGFHGCVVCKATCAEWTLMSTQINDDECCRQAYTYEGSFR